jgi:hypothetical protein
MIRLKTVTARQGLAWVREGARNFFRQPLGYTAIFSIVLLVGLLLSQLGWVGLFASLSLMPFATMGFTLAGREQRDGRSVHPGHLLPPWRDTATRNALLRLGAVYAVLFIGCLLLSMLVDGGRGAQLMDEMAAQAGASAASGAASAPLVVDEALLSGALGGSLLAMLLFGLLALVFWHAPALVAWQREPIAKALFASVLACWRARGAFTLMGLVWLGLMMLFMVFAQFLFTLFGQAQGALLAAMPAALMFSTAFYASLYAIYTDSFEVETADA